AARADVPEPPTDARVRGSGRPDEADADDALRDARRARHDDAVRRRGRSEGRLRARGRAAAAATARLAGLGLVQADRSSNQGHESLLIDFIVLVDVDCAPGVAFEARVEQSRRVLQ